MKINETVRKDGLRIISCRLPHKKKVFVDLIARVGSAYDPDGKSGLFHCFEHMAFKGTKKRSIKNLQSFNRKNLFYSNAFTEPLLTVYEASTIDSKLPLICDYLCDIYFNSTFPIKELQKEKKTIYLEIARRKDNDKFMAYHALDEHLYKESPLRFWGSSIEGVGQIKHEDLIKQKKRWHVSSNTIALAIGSVDHNRFVNEINKRVPLNYTTVTRKYWRDEAEDLPIKYDFVIRRPKREKTIILLGCKIPLNLDLKTIEAFSLFSKMMGMDNTSRLYSEIREKHGLAYAVGSAYVSTPGLGDSFRVYAEIEPANAKRVEKLIWRSLMRPLSEKNDFEELRESILDSFKVNAFEQSKIETYENLILRNIVEEKPVKRIETRDKRRIRVIKALSLKDLVAVQKKFIRPERFVRVLLRPE